MDKYDICDECGVELVPEVLKTPTGFYVGVRCPCGKSDARLSNIVDEHEAHRMLKEMR
jgi:hypothetical protein